MTHSCSHTLIQHHQQATDQPKLSPAIKPLNSTHKPPVTSTLLITLVGPPNFIRSALSILRMIVIYCPGKTVLFLTRYCTPIYKRSFKLDKQCASDPLRTSWLKGNVDLLAPFFVELFNQSLSMGYVPAAFREAYITPLLKRQILIRPTQGLIGQSQIYLFCRSCSSDFARQVARQLLDYLNSERLLPNCSRHIELSIRQRQRFSR